MSAVDLYGKPGLQSYGWDGTKVGRVRTSNNAQWVTLAQTGSVTRDVILFDDAPASVAISSGVVSFVTANLVTKTYNELLAYKRYRVKMTLIGTTTQEYAVITINADSDIDAVNKLSHSMTPSDAIGGFMVLPNVIDEGEVEDAITRIDVGCVASGTLPATDNGAIITVEVW